jgi:hypothetical protein
MPERPPAIKRLDSLLSAAMIAHEAIFEMRRKLIAADRANPEQARLLEESARLVTVELSGLSAQCPPAINSARTLPELEAELNRVEPRFRSLHKRQRQIARQMRAMLES